MTAMDSQQISNTPSTHELSYVFRKPIYPVICDIDGYVIAAKSDKSFVKRLSVVKLVSDKTYNLVDSSAEGWVFMPKHMLVSPLTFKKQWSKKEIISIFNNRINSSSDGVQYSEKSLSAKRFERIFGDIVDLLLKSTAKPPLTVRECFEVSGA
jgi:hypothetical protein